MFKKLVSHLKFSPSLIGELAELANRLRVQNPVRIASVVTLGLLLVIQLALYTNPPSESRPTYAGSMFFDSSIQVNDVVNQINNNYRSTGDIFNSIGISKTNIEQSSVNESPGSESSIYRLSRWPVDQSSESIKYGSHMDVYLTPIDNWTEVKEFESPFITGKNNEDINYFISTTTGSMYLGSKPNQADNTSPINLSIEYINISTQTKNAEPLKSSDRVKFTLNAINTSNEVQEHQFRLSLGDAMEYLNVETDTSEVNGPRISDVSKDIVWSPSPIEGKSSSSREVVLKVKSTASNLPRNSAHPYSQDCLVTLIHGNQIDIPVECSLQKELEMFTKTLPAISQNALLLWTGLAFFTSLVLLAKALQEEEEIRIIRHKFNNGA